MWKYQVVLLEQDDVELKATAIVNPAMFLTTENPTEKLEHDCLVTIEQVYSSRPDLKDEPLKDPDLELFTDGSSFVQEGRRIAGYAIFTTDKVLESGTLPANTSAQKAELVALKQALRMAEGRRVNIWTDSKYAFGVIHAHGAIWKEGGLLSAQGSPIKYKEEVLQLLQDVQKPKEVAVMHCKAHQFGQTAINIGNRLADKAAKEAAERGILALVPVKQIKIPNLKARYSKLDEQLAENLKASQNAKGWFLFMLGAVNSADTKVSEEGGGGGAPGAGAEIPLQPMEVDGGANIHLQPVEDPMPEQLDVPKGSYDPTESPCWNRLLAGPVDLWRERSPHWSRFAGRTQHL
ncbi:protein NYNRIN-like [Grus japonensis]|uniref:Protein NYNRIN-like n=1 Tax=Grus japonensis TaxID=30415 RepID=A0ABC9YCB2_GRUJA